MKSSPDERVGWLMHHRLSPRAGPAHFGNPGQRAVAAESLPEGGEGLAAHGVHQIGRQVGQRLEHVGVFKDFITRQNQPTKLSDLIVVEKYVEVETGVGKLGLAAAAAVRSEEHTSELQSRGQLVCRLLLEKKKKKERR